jgi:hypothetical protein
LALKNPSGGRQAHRDSQTEKATAPPTYEQGQLQIQETEQDEDVLDQTEKKRGRFRKTAFGPTFHHQWIVSLAWVLFLTGIGTTVGAITQSWLMALAALAIAGIAGYFSGYRKALDEKPLAITAAVSLVLTLTLTLVLAQLNYVQPMQVPYTAAILSRDITVFHASFVGRQLTFGLICGSITALAAVITAIVVCPPWGKKERPVWHAALYGYRPRKAPASKHLTGVQLMWIFLATYPCGVGLTALIAFIAATSNWGFGWDTNANIMELGFLLGSSLVVGIGASIPIWWTALTGQKN